MPFPRLAPTPLAGALLLAALPCGALAQDPAGAGPGLRLRSTERLPDAVPSASGKPVFLSGQRISGQADLQTVVEGGAMLRRADTVIQAERLAYDQETDAAQAQGSVRIQRAGNIYEGTALQLKVGTFDGVFSNPRYRFVQNAAHGDADRAEFQGPHRTVVHNATYTTCRRDGPQTWLPDWILRADTIALDTGEDVGLASGAALHFKGVPILPVPAISFPLSARRKSGLLPPTLGVDNVNGVEVGVPYYWNIAPNRDATLTPTLMTARGVDLGAEFRYLEIGHSGALRGNLMPGDKLRHSDRWGLSWVHSGSLDSGFESVGRVALGLNLNRVSDDDYWRDFTRSGPTLTQRLLPNDLTLSWGRNAWSTQLRVLQWQTLQDPATPIVPPYDRAPQWALRYAPEAQQGAQWSIDADATQFVGDAARTGQPNAQRAFTLAQWTYPLLRPEGFLRPRVQLHASAYQFDAALADGRTSAERVVPTLSLDAGLVFEREWSLGGRKLLQTLEPRAFYVLTPFRDQRGLPNYDTAANDFNFATIFTENAFVGHDKLSDNNLLTLGLSTRWLDADSGAQVARFGVAQRLRFEDQRVTLQSTSPGEAAGVSDILLGAAVNLQDRWVLDSTVQYNPRTDRSVRATVGARYAPGAYRVFNTAYRYQRDLSEQVDFNWQWPLGGGVPEGLLPGQGLGPGRYYSVGRLNYSLSERRLVDTVLGLEYDAGCWLSRLVLERIQTSPSSATQRIMLQLEFVGFTRLGISPQRTLTQNIGRYQALREGGSTLGRFSQYD